MHVIMTDARTWKMMSLILKWLTTVQYIASNEKSFDTTDYFGEKHQHSLHGVELLCSETESVCLSYRKNFRTHFIGILILTHSLGSKIGISYKFHIKIE